MIQIPLKFQCMFKSHRYKVWHGGRGGAKSWSVADGLLLLGAKKRLRILCTREFQNSIKDSVHKLLSDRIAAHKLSGFYEILSNSIRGKNGTEFIFEGIKSNVNSIKSMEGIDICWVEEAQKVSKNSWEVLIPTIRKDGSEIWVTFNPELETDETYIRFVLDPPASAKVIEVNWEDNPFFPSVLRTEMEELKRKDPDAYLHIWRGKCRSMLEGAVYANELRAAEGAGRITKVPYDPTKPVHTFWDLGWRDATAIWFAQIVGFEYRVIDYLEDSQKTVNYYVKQLQEKQYLYGTDYLPHDADNTQLAAGGRTIKSIMVGLGRSVKIVPNLKVAVGINAARTIFENCWFDQSKCSEGLNCLRRYRYERDPDTNTFGKLPLHDEYSHGADAFRYLALSLHDKKERKLDLMPKTKINLDPAVAGTGWMNA